MEAYLISGEVIFITKEEAVALLEMGVPIQKPVSHEIEIPEYCEEETV